MPFPGGHSFEELPLAPVFVSKLPIAQTETNVIVRPITTVRSMSCARRRCAVSSDITLRDESVGRPPHLETVIAMCWVGGRIASTAWD